MPLLRATLFVKPPSYESIMEHDGKIRQFTLPRADMVQDYRAISMRVFGRLDYQELVYVDNSTMLHMPKD